MDTLEKSKDQFNSDVTDQKDGDADEAAQIDWKRIEGLRVTQKILSALSNLEIATAFILPANRRRDARKKHLGHGTRRMMAEAEMPLKIGERKAFSSIITRYEQGREKWRDDCLDLIEEAVDRKEPLVKESHVGLMQVAAPILVKNRCVGVIRCGEFLPGKMDSLTVEKLREKLSYLKIPEREMKEEIDRIPFFASEKVAVVLNLMEMLTQEISSYIEETTKDDPTASEIDQHSYHGLMTKNPTVLDIIRQIKLIGASGSSVIIYGESGTGKELTAKLIHEHSNRKTKPLVTINCAALTETLLEAELFGYRRGAFTGATDDKKGLFEVAHEGTVFLDEVGEMSLALQVKLLRLIQEGTFMRVGDTETRQVDVRIISATHRDLRKLIELGKFREDLYYRLAVVELTLPPLRDRPEDIPLLIHRFLEEFQKKTGKQGIALSTEALQIFQEYYWPGNIREIRNEIERIVALRDSHTLVKGKDLSKKFFYETYPEGVKAGDEEDEGFIKTMVEEFEKSLLSKYLRKHKWNKTKVARLCGITRQGLNKKISKYRLDRRRV